MEEENTLTAVEDTGLASNDSITLNPADLENASEWEDFISLWMVSKDFDIRNQWYKGDIAQRLAVVHGESSLTKFAADVHEERVTVEGYRRIARAFPKETRIYNLSWTHYFIASFTDSFKKGAGVFEGNERFKWIEKANDEGWSTTRMKEEIKKSGALINEQKDVYTYYDEYLSKVQNILLHVEKAQMTRDQAIALSEKIGWIRQNFDDYLGITKQISP
jgi:hypothetical protein